jgi:RloB-like protein
MAKRRSVRSAAAFARREPTREPYDYILIVCEGAKTEPNYLHGLRTAYSLSSANIKIAHGGTAPRTIVEYTLAEMAKDNYNRAYCVFDRDGHQTYDEALQLIAPSDVGKNGRVLAITSWPCFEVWVLLHFAYTSAPFTATGKKSAGDRVLGEVVKRMASYTKGHKGIFEILAPRLTTALSNAERLEKHNAATQTTNPHTKMHRLVAALTALKKG